MPNPTTGFESQFTPSFNWGNGFSSFDIATQQESIIIGTNPTNTANRTRKILEYDLAGKLIENKYETVSQFQSYGKKFLKDNSVFAEYEGFGYTPAGTDGYLIKLASTQTVPVINDTVNSFTMAGTLNTNKSIGVSLINLGVGASAG